LISWTIYCYYYKDMKKILIYLLLVLPISLYGQTFSYEYNVLIDYNNGVRREHLQKGKWVFNKEDSLLVQYYEGGSLEYNVVKINNRYVYYKNDFDEIIIVTFTLSNDVIVKSEKKTNSYLIFRDE